jgi:hypothetical protein
VLHIPSPPPFITGVQCGGVFAPKKARATLLGRSRLAFSFLFFLLLPLSLILFELPFTFRSRLESAGLLVEEFEVCLTSIERGLGCRCAIPNPSTYIDEFRGN